MIEGLFIIAIGALILLYAQRQSDQKTIEQQEDKIIRQLRSEDEYSEFEPEENIKERAKAKFRQIYEYEYKE